MTLYTLGSLGLLDALDIKADVIWKYLGIVEVGYRDENPYHNSVHAADVVQTVACMVKDGEGSRRSARGGWILHHCPESPVLAVHDLKDSLG